MAQTHRNETWSKQIRSRLHHGARPDDQTLAYAGGAREWWPDPTTLQQLRSLASSTQRLWRDSKVMPGVPSQWNAEHSEHAAQVSLMIAHVLGLSSETCQRIYRAAYLHDVGSVGVPPTILGKRAALTKSERNSMQVHPLISRELLAALLPTGDIAGIALSHHERYDGNGYPQGLQGARIPIEARVLAVADSLDGMLSEQPYRDALPFSLAWAELIREAGRQFDPSIVEVLDRGATLRQRARPAK